MSMKTFATFPVKAIMQWVAGSSALCMASWFQIGLIASFAPDCISPSVVISSNRPELGPDASVAPCLASASVPTLTSK